MGRVISLEPDIVINGVKLSQGQAMAMRVAICSFHSEMQQPDILGKDDHGKFMAKAYSERAGEIIRVMLPG